MSKLKINLAIVAAHHKFIQNQMLKTDKFEVRLNSAGS